MSLPPFTVKALHPYKSDYDDDLSFDQGQLITVTAVEDDDWYSGTCDGQSGMFPKNFVAPIESEGPGASGAGAVGSVPVESESKSSDTIKPVSSDLVPEPLAKPPVDDPEPELAAKEVPESPVQEAPTKESPVSSPAKESTAKETAKAPVKSSMAVFPGSQKRDDPYAVKKQFIAESKSSYVPQVKPRDDSFLIGGHANREEPRPTEVAKESRDSDHDEPEEAKLSLKERIALLQKRQQEEAEREEASRKKQELRKQKLAEEKERKKQEAAQDPEEPKRKSIDRSHTGSSHISTATTGTSGTTGTTGTGVSRAGSIGTGVGLEDEQPEQVSIVEGDDEDEAVVKDTEEFQDADEAKEDEEDDDEDDEELRRRKLVERMAKISGGRNMFGMMGMSPFGQAPPKKSTKSKEPELEPEEEEPEPEEPKAVPTPMVPFADPTALEKLKHKEVEEEETEVPPAKEDSSMGEDDEPTEPEPKVPPRSAPAVPPVAPVDRKTAIQSDSGLDESESGDDIMKLKQNTLEREHTGYEADEDLSDRKIVESSNESTPVLKTHEPGTVPPIPDRSLPPTPERNMKAPPIPSAPAPSREVPPVPLAPVVPPVPVPAPVPASDSSDEAPEADSASDSDADLYHEGNEAPGDDDNFQFEAPNKSYTLPPNMPPPVPENRAIPEDRVAPPVPLGAPPSGAPGAPPRASTDIHAPLAKTDTGASFASVTTRNSHGGSKKDHQADTCLEKLESEIANITSTSNWWLKDALPESLTGKIGTELVYEVDSNSITKRGNTVKNYKDYYILFYDLSQLIFELEYEVEDPRTTIKFTNYYTKPSPIIRKDLLDKYHRQIGGQILKICSTINGSHESIIEYVFSKLGSDVLPPIGTKSYGVNIYKNVNNHNIAKIDDIKPGDILCIKNGKFQVHKGLGSKTILVGDDEIYASVIYEYDPKKEKIKVYEISNGQLKKESYKLGEMKSGQVRVFRVVGRDYIEW